MRPTAGHRAFIRAATLLAGALIWAGNGLGAEDLEITYLANEGFLLRAGEARVLVDGLFGEGLRGYGVVAREERHKLETAQEPYTGIDLVLASHVHRDHFDAEAVARFLRANREARFISTEDALKALLAVDRDLSSRASGHWPPEEERIDQRLAGLDISLFNLHHGRDRPTTQNLGLLVKICGSTVLHIGDTEADAADLRLAGLAGLRPDVALLPSWFLRPSRWSAAVEVLRPRHIVAMHLPAADAPRSYFYGGTRDLGGLKAAITAGHPAAWIPVRTGDTRRYSCGLSSD